MTTKEQPTATYAGDTFKALMRRYSNERMKLDPAYRRSVFKSLAQRGKRPAKSK